MSFLENKHWLLPEGVEEVLPPLTQHIEAFRRQLLDEYASWGYELVMPPFIDYLDALLTGTGNDLALQTFTLTDQMSGRLLGVRADMTPQVARIDAHQLKREEPTRLCYIGTVLHTRPDGFGGSRSPLQVGAELYGHAGVESDYEVLALMLATLRVANIAPVYLDLGHVGIYRGLARAAGLSAQQETALFEALQRKARDEVLALIDECAVAGGLRSALLGLIDLNGGREVLDQARDVLREAPSDVISALQDLERLAALLAARHPDIPVHFDLAELRAYHYQTGVVFAAFVPGHGQEVARGGRYDEIGKAFGRARPATGFSSDLKTLVELSQTVMLEHTSGIWAPWSDDAALAQVIFDLRAKGERVVVELPGQVGDALAMKCDRKIISRDGQWVVANL